MAIKLDRIKPMEGHPEQWEGWTVIPGAAESDEIFRPPLLVREPKYKIVGRYTEVGGCPYRFYRVVDEQGNDFLAPSATSYIGAKDAANMQYGLKKWADIIGKDYASLISDMAPYLGDQYHRSIEWALKGKMTKAEVKRHVCWDFLQDVAYLIGAELSVVSRLLGVCGTLDILYVNHSNEVVLADGKTVHKRYAKDEEGSGVIAPSLPRELDQEWAKGKLGKYRKQMLIYDLGIEETYGLRVQHHDLWSISTVNFLTNKVKLFNTPGGYTRTTTAVFKAREEFNRIYGLN